MRAERIKTLSRRYGQPRKREIFGQLSTDKEGTVRCLSDDVYGDVPIPLVSMSDIDDLESFDPPAPKGLGGAREVASWVRCLGQAYGTDINAGFTQFYRGRKK